MTQIEGLTVSVEQVSFEVAKLQLGRIVVEQAAPLAAPQSSEKSIEAIAGVVKPGQSLEKDIGFKATVFRRVGEVLPVGDPQDFKERQAQNERFAAFMRRHQILTRYKEFPELDGAVTQPLKYRQLIVEEAVASSAARNLESVVRKQGERMNWTVAAAAAAQYFEADARQGSTLLIALHRDEIREMSKEWLRIVEPEVVRVNGEPTTAYTELGKLNPAEKVRRGRRKQELFPIDHFWKLFSHDADELRRLARVKSRGQI